MLAKIISVVSGKGGTGKSTISAGLALSLAKENKKVLIVDFDIGLRALDIMLGVENSVVFDLGDVLNKKCADEAAMIKVNTNLVLMCTPMIIDDTTNIGKMLDLIEAYKNIFDYIVLDLPAGLGLSVMVAERLSDLCIIVATTDTVTMRDSRKICDAISENRTIKFNLIINKVSKQCLKAGGINNLDEVMDAIGVPLIGVLQEDNFISGIYSKGVVPKGTSVEVIDAIAKRICGEYVPLVVKKV